MKNLFANLFAVGLTLAMTLRLPIPTVWAQSTSFEKQAQTSIAGIWNSSEGTITFQQSGSNVSGTYTQDNGVIEGSISGNILTGYWIEDASSVRCSTPRNGSYHWGKIRFVFNGSSFRGLWSYCGAEPTSTWTGNFIRDIPAVVPPPQSVPQPVVSVSIAGVWNTSEGAITFKQSGSNVLGTYTQDNGVIEGSISSNVLTGYWIENSSSVRCDTPRNGSYHWGKISFVFDSSSFRGLWSYCDAEPTRSWTGNRIGS